MIVLIVMSVALILTSALYLDMRRRYHKVSLDAFQTMQQQAVAQQQEMQAMLELQKRQQGH